MSTNDSFRPWPKKTLLFITVCLLWWTISHIFFTCPFLLTLPVLTMTIVWKSSTKTSSEETMPDQWSPPLSVNIHVGTGIVGVLSMCNLIEQDIWEGAQGLSGLQQCNILSSCKMFERKEFDFTVTLCYLSYRNPF